MKIKAVVFDMDGTLTVPYLDFDAIRAEMGGVSGPILEAMEQMPVVQRNRCAEILHAHEMEAAEQSQLNPGVRETLRWLADGNRPVAVLTRNQRVSVDRVCELHDLRFDAVVTREDGPSKPDPFGVLRACELMNVAMAETLVVGDYVFDLMAARRAGAVSVLISTNSNHKDFVSHADHVISGLEELAGLIEKLENQP